MNVEGLLQCNCDDQSTWEDKRFFPIQEEIGHVVTLYGHLVHNIENGIFIPPYMLRVVQLTITNVVYD